MPTFSDPLSGVSHSDALKEYWVHADGAVTMHETLSFGKSPTPFEDANGLEMEARIVRGFTDINAVLEDDAALNAGEEVTFTAMSFDIDLPAEQDGGVPEINIGVDNVSREISDLLNQTIGTRDVVTVTHRRYLSTDLSGPHTLPATTLTLQGAEVSVDRVEAKAGFGAMNNTRWPADVHDVARFPGLTAR